MFCTKKFVFTTDKILFVDLTKGVLNSLSTGSERQQEKISFALVQTHGQLDSVLQSSNNAKCFLPPEIGTFLQLKGLVHVISLG